MLTEVLLVMAGLMLAMVGQWMVFDHTAPFFRAFDSHTKNEWLNRVITIVVDTTFVGLAMTQDFRSVWGLAITVGYFLFDVGHMLLYERDMTPYIHHVVSMTVVGLIRLTMTPEQAVQAVSACGVLETTTPILNLTWLLHKAGYGDHPAFKYLAGAMITFFAIMRCGVFPWMMTKMDMGSKLIFAPLLALNIYWLWKLINIGKKVITKAEEPALNTSQSPST